MRTNNPDASLPIGIFDSGVGGLTVLAALRARLAREYYIYLGDTARLPYGTKSKDTIVRYSVQATAKLVERRIKLLVVACNTATAAALPDLQKKFAPLPVIGVVEPGARAACKAVAHKREDCRILVLATESTINGAAYTRAIQALLPQAQVTGVSCSLLVPMAEEGWMTGPIVESVIRRYLEPLLGEKTQGAAALRPDCIVLGCTHFPPLAASIAAVAGKEARIIDSAVTTAEVVQKELQKLHLLRPEEAPEKATPGIANDIPSELAYRPDNPTRRLRLLTTDAPERFARIGSLFLNLRIAPKEVELVAL
ncbi:MAG: glutamate racemase [Desulfovibrio sp.]|nr:glutamate racemase [Desulfovibrio sp.]